MKALLIIDMLRDFVEPKGALPVPEAKSIIPAINREIAKARAAGEPVIFVCDSHAPNDREFKLWPKHAIAGSEGAKIVSELDFKKGDAVVKKKTYSAFYKTRLEKILKKRGADTLVLTGVLTDICVLHSASDAYLRRFKVLVPSDATASVSKERHEWALKHMREVLAARVE